MTLPNNYKFMFSDYTQTQPLWTRKKVEGADDTNVAVFSTDNDGNYIDLSNKQFLFLHSDGIHLTARKCVEGVYSDVNILLRAGSVSGDILMGKVIEDDEVVEEQEEVPAPEQNEEPAPEQEEEPEEEA